MGICAIAIGVLAFGCSGGSEGGGGVKTIGNDIGSGLSSLGHTGGNALSGLGHGTPGGVQGSTGNRDLDFLAAVGPKFFDAVDLENPERQQALGQSCALAVSNQYPLLTNANRNDYVNYVGLTVASVSPRPELQYTFGVLDTPDVNAYSTPGGFVFITRGALEMCSDESELAAVLAHEVGHVVRGHGIDAIRNAKYTDVVMTAAESRSRELQQFEQITNNAVQNTLNGIHSNEQEYQADSEAVKYLIAAGYDPNGMTRFLEKLQSKTGAGGLENIMKNHPGTAERVKRVKTQIASSGVQSGETLADRFQKWMQ
jgi:predicted Zn-dependent protease